MAPRFRKRYANAVARCTMARTSSGCCSAHSMATLTAAPICSAVNPGSNLRSQRRVPVDSVQFHSAGIRSRKRASSATRT